MNVLRSGTSDCDVCAAPDSPTPLEIQNRPGLPVLAYRIGDYVNFRQAMLEKIHRASVDGESVLSRWTVRRDDDFGIALIDMWAYIADILTFYQERIANEAFLRTAQQRESLRRLAALIDYRAAPGMAASVYLAFLLQAPTPSVPDVQLSLGLKSQSVPGKDEKPQKFETGETRLARFEWNLLQPQRFEDQLLTGASTSLYLPGRITTIKRGEMMLLVDKAGNWRLRQLIDVVPEGEQTKLFWSEPLSKATPDPEGTMINDKETPIQVVILRRRAALFGFNAPIPLPTTTITSHLSEMTIESTTDPLTTTTTFKVETKVEPTDPTAPPKDWTFDPPTTGASDIDLDAEYPKIIPGERVVLMRPTDSVPPAVDSVLTQVKSISTVRRVDYDISGKVTRLNLGTTISAIDLKTKFYDNLRKTAVLFGGDSFDLGKNPLTTAVAGNEVTIAGDFSALEKDRPLIFKGPSAGENADETAGETVGEVAFVNRVEVSGGNSRIILRQDLTHSYARATLEIYANALYATHGESVNEVLGSGDSAQAFQSFTLQKKPVTFEPDASVQGGAANSLELRVDGLLWQESRSFYGRSPTDALYTTRSNEAGEMIVTFGDGLSGRRLPMGRNNVTAHYRQGIGRAGVVRADTITTLLDKPTGVRSVLNPLPSQGGADAEAAASLRMNAPNTVRTFGRIISLRDFEDAAREHASIAKARAHIKWEGEEQVVHLTVAGDDGDEVTKGGTLYDALLANLNQQRDPNRSLRLISYTPKPVLLEAVLFINTPAYVIEHVVNTARAAIIGFFDFDHLELGQSVALNDLLAVLQNVPGVVAVDVNQFIFKEDSTATPPATGAEDVLPALPGELITLENPMNDLIVTGLDARRSQP